MHTLTCRLLLVFALLLTAPACASPSTSPPQHTTSSEPGDVVNTSAEQNRTPPDTLAAGVRALIEDDLAGLPLADFRHAEDLRRLYEQRSYRPAWYAQGTPRAVADSALATLRQADARGLVPADYNVEALQQLLEHVSDAEAPSPREVARFDVLLTAATMDYATDLYNGRIDPSAVDPDWYVADDTTNVARALQRGLEQGDVTAVLRDMVPPHEVYQRLEHAYRTYRTIAERGGWPTVPEGDVLHPGDSSARVPVLRERLAVTDDLPRAEAAEQDSLYDAQLAGAVYRFQQRHGLATDSLLGPSTREALNVPAAERVRTLALNLERWRWLPEHLGARHVLVNIPAFQLTAYRDGEVAQQMEVIAGKAYDGRATPVFADTMEHLIFSPFWNIPPSIANEEILPKARGNRSYLVNNNYEIVSHYGPGAAVYDPYSTSLARVASGELRLREKPGPTNALGLVKFMFPNEYAVYLHDTPADHLFDQSERDFSHSCVRVERPLDLAVYALSKQPAWTRDRIDEAMHDGEWQQVDLEHPIPVYLVYWTAFVDEDGTVHFREDIYDHDEALDRALRRAAPSASST